MMKLRVCNICNTAFYSPKEEARAICPRCGFVMLDKRLHKRIKTRVDFILNKDGAEIQAKLLDYSRDGAKIMYRGQPLTVGSIIDVTIEELDINGSAETVWAKKNARSFVSAGLRLL